MFSLNKRENKRTFSIRRTKITKKKPERKTKENKDF